MAVLSLNEKVALIRLKQYIDLIITSEDQREMDPDIVSLLEKESLSKTENNNKLTEKQSLVFEFIIDQIAKTGIPPTRSEISESFGFKSFNSSQEYLHALNKKGFIKLKPGYSRAIIIL
jgi:hypothetical protein